MVLYCIYVQVDYRQSVRNLPRAKAFAESGLISVTTSQDDLPVIYCFIDITLYIIRRFIHELPMIFYREMPADYVHSHFPPHFHSLKHTILPPLTLALVGLGVPVAAAVRLVDDALRVGRPLDCHSVVS